MHRFTLHRIYFRDSLNFVEMAHLHKTARAKIPENFLLIHKMGRVKRIWYLSPMRAAKVQASMRIRTVSPEPPLLAHTSSESRGTFRQKARSLAPLNGWTCAVKICHDGMLEDTNSLDGAQMLSLCLLESNCFHIGPLVAKIIKFES